MDGPTWQKLAGLIPWPGAVGLARQVPESALFLPRAAGVPGTGLRRWGGETNRYGARAFSTLEGYAGRNWRNGAGFARWKAGKRAATVPVFV
jgi:hypothetical protein